MIGIGYILIYGTVVKNFCRGDPIAIDGIFCISICTREQQTRTWRSNATTLIFINCSRYGSIDQVSCHSTDRFVYFSCFFLLEELACLLEEIRRRRRIVLLFFIIGYLEILTHERTFSSVVLVPPYEIWRE